MKIAVLFGSFNPLTNAHVAALKTAVEQVGAQKGLFVATSDAYLKKKAAKKGISFYLSAAERREIIEAVCAEEENLAFWGHELGGATPARYKTLCKIQKQYPEATLYEVQGADKVRTISKFHDGADYVSHIRFAVFGRDGIDPDSLLDGDPLLSNHKDAFLLLPPLGADAEISSTLVRERFQSGQDFSDLVPPSALEVMGRHRPDEVTLTYGDKMKAIITSGPHGNQDARKLVYKENTQMFLDWRDGKPTLIEGDYRQYLDETKHYSAEYRVDHLGTQYPETQTGCINIDCVDLARHLQKLGYDPAILNLASAKRPGGGYRDGLSAQEESLCCSSNLSLSLYQYGNPNRMVAIRESGVPAKTVGYPLDLRFGGLYTPNVTFFRHNRSKYYTLREDPFRCDVITVAALSFNGKHTFAGADELQYRSESGGFTPEGEEVMLHKIRTIFRSAVAHGKDSLILGAFGCGVYLLPVQEVARLFRAVMNEPEFAHKFRLITFAILEGAKKPGGLNGKFAGFYEEFGTYTL